MKMNDQEKRAACAAILANTMHGIGLKPEDYPAFFEAAIKKPLTPSRKSSGSPYKFNSKESIFNYYKYLA